MSQKDVEEWAAMIAQMQDDPSYHPVYNKKGVRTEDNMEKYRDADRNEEARQIFTQQENEELTESQQKQAELEPIPGVDWEKLYKKEHKLRQETEGELSIIKATTVTNSPEMREANKKIEHLQTRLAEVIVEREELAQNQKEPQLKGNN